MAVDDQFGQRFREIRSKESQKDFGEKLNVTRSYVSDIENCRVKPSLEYILNVATIYNISLDWLLLGREPGECQHSEPNEQESDSNLEEWISFFYSVPPDARPLLIGTVRTLLQNSYSSASSNPGNAPSTSPNTGDDEQAAAKSDIA